MTLLRAGQIAVTRQNAVRVGTLTVCVATLDRARRQRLREPKGDQEQNTHLPRTNGMLAGSLRRRPRTERESGTKVAPKRRERSVGGKCPGPLSQAWLVSSPMAGGTEGNLWVKILVGGFVGVAAATALEKSHTGPHWLVAALLALGGLAVVFGSCEAMIKCVEGVAARLRLNKFVAGTMAGLASNVPELVMLGFVIAKEPRVGFIVVAFTLHVGAMTFGIYSGLLPRDATGHAKLPEPLVKLSTDLYAGAGGAFLAMGLLMVLMYSFDDGHGNKVALTSIDLYVIGFALLSVMAVALTRMVKRFSGSTDNAGEIQVPIAPNSDAEPETSETDADKAKAAQAEAVPEGAPSLGAIIGYGLLGVATAVIGGHAVGDFADILVGALTAAGHSEMLGALILSVFATAGATAMIAAAHAKGMYDIALANVSGAVTQVPFVVLPLVLILIGLFAHTGVTPAPPEFALAIDLETTSVIIMAFPPMLILWKAIQDDGFVNWVETAVMVAIFGLTIYFLAAHG